MSLLVLQLPPRERLGARSAGADGPAAGRLPAEWTFVFSPDGREPGPLSHAPLALLPKAERVVLALAPGDVSWHALEVPRAPANRLRAALVGVLEDRLLDEEGSVHLALGPGSVPGKRGWVAATHAGRLGAALQALDAAGLEAAQVVPSALPAAPPRAHFFAPEGSEDPTPQLQFSSEDGVWCLPLSGGLARALQPAVEPTRWTATPAAALAAEAWLGRPVALQTEAEHLFEVASTALLAGANLRQFEFTSRHRGLRALGDGLKRLRGREWRAARWALGGLVALQLLGLNAYAWQQRQAVQGKRAEMAALLRTAHPGVRLVVDAPVQMAAETERLRAAAGRSGGSDLESLLGAAAAAWPDGQGPVPTLRYEAGRLELGTADWAEPQATQFRERLQGAGFRVEQASGVHSISRAAAGTDGSRP